jgi:hypothetical protein
VGIFYPSTGAVFSKEGIFEQPRLIASTTARIAFVALTHVCSSLLTSPTKRLGRQEASQPKRKPQVRPVWGSPNDR